MSNSAGPRSRLVIGSTVDSNGQSVPINPRYPPNDAGIRTALQDGYRWLVLSDFNYDINATIDLDLVSEGTLRLEGGGPNITHLNRKFTGGPLIKAFDTVWRLYFSGITFNGLKTFYNDPGAPTAICEFKKIQLSRFENCHWTDGQNGGLSLGDIYQADTTAIVNCRFQDNGVADPDPELPPLQLGTGLTILNGIDILVIGGAAERNTEAGVIWRGPPPGHVSYWTRGIGTIQGLHQELNGHGSANWGIVLDRVRAVKVYGCYMYGSRLWMTSTTNDCVVQDNVLLYSPILDQGVGNTKTRNPSYTAP